MKNILIRNLEQSDIPEVKKLLQEMWLLHSKNNLLLDSEKLLALNVESHLDDVIKDNNKIFLVAIDNNTIVGTAMAEIKKCPSYYKYDKEFYVDDVSVKENFRRNGIASRLVTYLIKEAEKRNIKLLTAKLYKFNSPTRELFKSLGFEEDYSFFSKKG